MQAASSPRHFVDRKITSRYVCGRAYDRGAPSSCELNFRRAALSASAALFNLRLSAVLLGSRVDSQPSASEWPRINV